MTLPEKNLFAWLTIPIALLIVSPLVHATPLDGNFSGTTTSLIQCSSPSISASILSTTITLLASSNSVTITITSGDYTYSGSGIAVAGSPDQFNIGTSGNIVITNPGPIVGSGSATYVVSVIVNADGTLNYDFGAGTYPTSICGVANIFITDATTLSASGGEALLVTETTTGSETDVATKTQKKVTKIVKLINIHADPHKRDADPQKKGRQQLTQTDAGFNYEGGISGLNAGDSAISYGAWVSYSYSDFENDFSGTAFESTSHSVLAGVDFAPWEGTVLGLAVGYESDDTDTLFNSGNVESDTFTIAPYFGALLTDIWSMDFSFGYSRIEFDQFRTAPGTTTRITSDPTAEQWFWAFNVNGLTYYDNWIIGGRMGIVWAKNVLESFTESNDNTVAEFRTRLGTFNAAADVAYSYNEFEPFISVTYEHDYNFTKLAVAGTGPQPANDDDDILATFGMRYFGDNGITGNLEYTKRFDRDDFDEDRVSLILRVDF